MNNLVFMLGSWATTLPALWRKRVYNTVKVLAGLATVALLVLPYLPQVGINLPTSVRWDALLTGLLTVLGQLASRNTSTDPLVDVTPAPEVHPADSSSAPVNASNGPALDTGTATASTGGPAAVTIDPRTERPA